MSKLAVKLYTERELLAEAEKRTTKDNYSSLLCAVFGEREFDSALNEDVHFQAEIETSLFGLEQSNPYGMLQRYFIEEYFLHGKSKEEIGKEIAAHMDLLLSDLETDAVRFLRRPEQAKELAKYIGK